MKEFTHCLKSDYTYKDLTKPINREYMQALGVSSLGTQSGGFGAFKGQFKVISVNSVEVLKQELENATSTLADLIDECPTLRELLK